MDIRPLDFVTIIIIATILIVFIVLIVQVIVFLAIFRPWLKALKGNAGVSFFDLTAMALRRVDMNSIVDAKVMAIENGVFDAQHMSNATLQGWSQAGVDVLAVVCYMSAQKGLGHPVKEFDVLCEQYLAGKLPI